MKKIVVIGGGSGSYTALTGLRKYPVKLSAIVSMFDSGGSTGRLRDELGVLPPGDVRRCLIALSDDNDQNILRELFEYRFEGAVENHSLGNLIITAAEKNYGSLSLGLTKLSQILNLKGKVIPVSLDQAQLCARLQDGRIIHGETNIDVPKTNRAPINHVYLEPTATLNPDAKDEILNADLIVIGPGDLYTSLIPNLLVQGMSEALNQTKAKIVYVCNLMTKQGETDGYLASKFLSEIESYAKIKVDNIICNENGIKSHLLEKYRAEGQFPVVFDLAHDHRAVLASLVYQPSLVRHDSLKLARGLIRLC